MAIANYSGICFHITQQELWIEKTGTTETSLRESTELNVYLVICRKWFIVASNILHLLLLHVNIHLDYVYLCGCF